MARPIVVAIGQVVGSNWQPSTGLSNVNLRIDPFTTAAYTSTGDIGDGMYLFPDVVLDGEYRVYVGSSEQTYFGTLCIGKATAVLITGNQSIAGVKTASGQWVFSAGFKTDTIAENSSGVGVTIDGVLIKDSLDVSGIVAKTGGQTIAGLKTFSDGIATDTIAEKTADAGVTVDGILLKNDLDTSNIVTKSTSQIIAGAKQFTGNVVINTASSVLSQSAYQAPTDNKWYAPKKYVDDAIIAYLTGLVIPQAQQSDRTIRVIYGGTFEGGANPRVELTIDNAIAAAFALTPAITKQYYIFVEKNGLETGYGANAVLSDIKDYVHIQGENIGCLISPADNTFICGGLGRIVIRDCTLDWSAGMTATPSFTNVIFENVTFSINDNALGLDSCLLMNCRVTNTGGGTWSVTNCNGTAVIADVLPAITGYAPKVYVAGDYNQRNLGTLPVIASAGTITLTYGNQFELSGTTTITNITTTGWTDGSIIILYFAGAITLTNNNAGAGHFALDGATDFVGTSGDVIQLMLRSSVWYQVAPASVN